MEVGAALDAGRVAVVFLYFGKFQVLRYCVTSRTVTATHAGSAAGGEPQSRSVPVVTVPAAEARSDHATTLRWPHKWWQLEGPASGSEGYNLSLSMGKATVTRTARRRRPAGELE